MTSARTRIPETASGVPADVDRPAVVAYSAFIFSVLSVGDFWRYLLGWPAYLGMALVLAVISGVLVRRSIRRISVRRLPWALVGVFAWCVISLIWSDYRPETVAGILTQWAVSIPAILLATRLSWRAILRAFSWAFMGSLAASLLFELWAAAIVRHGIFPTWEHYSGPQPEAYYWTRAELFTGGQIQGVVGNSNLLAMIALLGLIVFDLRLADRSLTRFAGIFWIAVAVLTLGLTRSSTVIVATVFVAVVFGFAMWARAVRPIRRPIVYIGMLVAVVLGGGGGFLFRDRVFELLGKSDSLTGRTGIWDAVIGLAEQRPVFGWGWISYWAPWIHPFEGLAVRKGVQYLQAHDAWLDVWLQLGIIGLVLFVAAVLSTWGRTWLLAVDRVPLSATRTAPCSAVSLLPLLVISAYIAQSFAESRLLIEAGWTVLVLFSLKTKQPNLAGDELPISAAPHEPAVRGG